MEDGGCQTGTVREMRENKFKVQTSVCRVMTSVFWDREGILFMEFLKTGAIINSVICADIKGVITKNSMGSAKNKDESTHPICSPNLATPDFHLFSPLKNAIFHVTR
jgi:hypothetical protein